MPPVLNSPLSITLSITQTCNLECKHCYADCQASEASAEVTTDEWQRFLDYLVRNDFISVYFEGGEPLFREDFLQILEHCARRMMTMLRSNGTLINREMAHRLKQIGIGRVLVDLMGARAARLFHRS